MISLNKKLFLIIKYKHFTFNLKTKKLLPFTSNSFLYYFTFLLGTKKPKINHTKTMYGKRFIGQAGIGHKLL